MNFLKNLLHSFNEGFLVLDPSGNVVLANEAAEKITGYSRDALLGLPLAALYSDGAGDKIKADYELQIAQQKGKFISTGWKLKADGTTFWGEFLLSPIYNEHNEFSGFNCLLFDYTDKKRLESRNEKNNERYRFLVEGVQDYAIFFVDTAGLIQTWNEGSKILTGYSVSEIIGKPFSLFYAPAERNDLNSPSALSLAFENSKYETEGWRVRKNGSFFWACLSITTLFNEQNQHIGYSVVLHDLSTQKQKEEDLRQSEERYRLLVAQVIDYGIFMLDEKGRIISWNEGANRIKGYVVNEVIGKYFSIFYPQEDIMAGKPAMELEVAISQGKYEEEGWRIRKNGEKFWASIVITAVHNDEGNLIGFSKVTRDLTERKKLEWAVKESSGKYKLLAGELKIKNTELSRVNEELEQFTSVASHDLQEPIRTIRSFLKVIDAKIEKGEVNGLHVYTQKALNAATRMRELIQNLLKYSQINNDTLIVSQISIDDMVQQVLNDLKAPIDESGVLVGLDINVKYVEGERIQISQVLLNLMSNAIKFNDNAVPTLQLKVVEEDDVIQFSVADNGIGIPAEESGKVFEIFRRLHTKRDIAGTGIGLSICKKIIARHRGKIWFESEVNKGTTFYFTLPIK